MDFVDHLRTIYVTLYIITALLSCDNMQDDGLLRFNNLFTKADVPILNLASMSDKIYVMVYIN